MVGNLAQQAAAVDVLETQVGAMAHADRPGAVGQIRFGKAVRPATAGTLCLATEYLGALRVQPQDGGAAVRRRQRPVEQGVEGAGRSVIARWWRGAGARRGYLRAGAEQERRQPRERRRPMGMEKTQ